MLGIGKSPDEKKQVDLGIAGCRVQEKASFYPERRR
jgi:hypothetical protein